MPSGQPVRYAVSMKPREKLEQDIKKLARQSWWVGAAVGAILGFALGFAFGYGEGSSTTVVIPLQQGINT